MGAKARADTRPEIRGGLKRMFVEFEQKGKPVSTIWKEIYEADPIKFMQLAIQCQPKDVEIDANVSNTINVNTNQIADEVYQTIVEQERERRTH